MKLKEVFGEDRIVGLAGDKSSGKTNNLIALLKDFRKHNKETAIYVYGLNNKTMAWVRTLKNVFEVSSIKQLVNKKNSLIILEEFQKLKLNDRRNQDEINAFVDFIYHNNNWCILSSPNLREFNTNIGGKIERWLLKSLSTSNCINGSQLKDVVMGYSGGCKVLGDIVIEQNKILIINPNHEIIIELDYIKEIDDKKNNVDIFEVKK